MADCCRLLLLTLLRQNVAEYFGKTLLQVADQGGRIEFLCFGFRLSHCPLAQAAAPKTVQLGGSIGGFQDAFQFIVELADI